jgi:hypothetical protein
VEKVRSRSGELQGVGMSPWTARQPILNSRNASTTTKKLNLVALTAREQRKTSREKIKMFKEKIEIIIAK